MGSLKDEMRGLGENHKPSEKADDGGLPGDADGCAVPGATQIITSQESTSQGHYEPGLHMDASCIEEGDRNPIAKEKELSGGMCADTDRSDCVGVEDSTQAGIIPLIQQPEAYKASSVTLDGKIISSKLLSDGDGGNQGYEDESMVHEAGKKAEIENVLVPVPLTPGPSDPWSPAPVGQHHMRTQVSLEVVQCQSAATSPMTPPDDSHSFFFPSALARSGNVGAATKDAELQVGKQVEFCSVATSPMTPKTPSTTAFPELIGRESVQKEENVKKSEGQRKSDRQGSVLANQSSAKAVSEIRGDLKFTTSTELSEDFGTSASPESFVSCPTAELTDSQGTPKKGNQQRKQQKMGSMDQDITIMVTHYNNNEEEESTFYLTETEMVKIDEYEELGGSQAGKKSKDGKENISTETVPPDHMQGTSTTTLSGDQTEDGSVSACDEAKADVESEHSEVTESKDLCVEVSDVSVMKPVPESPAPFGCHNIRTQVSLEVAQCQSAATSPMTPPEGDHAFNFPSSFGRCTSVGTETKDAELQAGQQVEYRSVATAPMTPRTPTTTTFPEIKRKVCTEQKTVENEDKKERAVEDKEGAVKEEEKVPEEEKVEATEGKEGVVKEEETVPEEEEVEATEGKEGVVKEEKVSEDEKVAAMEDIEGAVKEEEKVPEEVKVAVVEDKEGVVNEEKVPEEEKVVATKDKDGVVKEEEKVPEEEKGAATEDTVGVVKEEKVPEEEKGAATEDIEGVIKEEEKVPEEERVEATEDKEGVVNEEKVPEEEKAAASDDTKETTSCKDKVEEPVQDVSWDEKGMTWEVYGAVVEVTVLGSAIQKHLEKQVKKRQPSMPPPPPLSPSAIPLSPESVQGGSTKGRGRKRREQDEEASRRRRNPFRLMMENMQQPHCCAKAHTTE